jgi:hypothetical protein
LRYSGRRSKINIFNGLKSCASIEQPGIAPFPAGCGPRVIIRSRRKHAPEHVGGKPPYMRRVLEQFRSTGVDNADSVVLAAQAG